MTNVLAISAVGDVGRKTGHRKAFQIKERKCYGRK